MKHVSTGVVFGAPKTGKTSTLVGAFPNALFIGAPPAITLVAQNEYGYSPRVWPWQISATETVADYYGLPSSIETLDDLLSVLQMIGEQGYTAEFDAIVNDDLTPIARRSVLVWGDQAPLEASGKTNFFYPYAQLAGHMVRIASVVRHLGCHGWSTAWERGRSYNKRKNVWAPGGPDVGSAEQTSQLPGWFDTNVRAITDPTYPDPWMQAGLWADVRSTEWKTGDRNGVAINGRMVPPNVRELLNAAKTPYVISRLPGLEWQDELAEEVAGVVLQEGVRTPQVWALIERAFGGSVPTTPRTEDALHVRWAVQDGIARGALRRVIQSSVVSRDAWLTGTVPGAQPSRRPAAPPRPQPPEAEEST